MKYARIVFEIEIEEHSTDKQILDAIEGELGDYMTSSWNIHDVEIHDRPYKRNI